MLSQMLDCPQCRGLQFVRTDPERDSYGNWSYREIPCECFWLWEAWCDRYIQCGCGEMVCDHPEAS